MSTSQVSIPTLHTLAALSKWDADVLLHSAEQLHLSQASLEAQRALRRIAVYRRVFRLPISLNIATQAA